MLEESMALETIIRISSRNKKNKCLTPAQRRLLCNVIVLPHFYDAY